MNFIDDAVAAYAQAHTRQHSAKAEEIHRWTIENSESSQMLSGSVQAAVLQLLIHACAANRVLEVGMYTGYSALAMAEALPENGELITLDIDPQRQTVARSFFDSSEAGGKIQIIIGPALETLGSLTGHFDLAYIDADKVNYCAYYEMIVPMIRSGGIIVADNVLWSSKVLNPDDESSEALHAFNRHVQQDPRVTNVLLTVRDGLMVACKN